MRRKPSAAASLDCCYRAVAIALSQTSFLPFSLCSSHSPLNLLQLPCPPATGFWFGFVKLPHPPREGCSSSEDAHTTRGCVQTSSQGYQQVLCLQRQRSSGFVSRRSKLFMLLTEAEKGRNWINTWFQSSSWPSFLGELNRMPCSCSKQQQN